MPLLSIEISDHDHQRLEARAADHGMSLEAYVLDRTLGGEDSSPEAPNPESLQALMGFLETRAEEARAGKTVRLEHGQLSRFVAQSAASQNS
ncbi:MAG: hypothetical protein ACPGOY_03035 [Rhodospirillaceae bacterium]